MAITVNNVSIHRCLADGTFTEEGTYLHVSFEWDSGEDYTEVRMRWRNDFESVWTSDSVYAAKAGSVNKIYGGGNIDPERRYIFVISVIAPSSKKHFPIVLKTPHYTIDRRHLGTGISFGKTAELDDVMDVDYQTRMLGGILQPIIPFGTDLNDVVIPNTYTGGSMSTHEYANCPMTSGTFILKVEAAGDEGQLRQTFTHCHKFAPKTFTRFYYGDAWGSWMHVDNTEFVLYENSSGGSGTVSLSQSASDFTYLDIYYTDNNGKGGGHARVMNPDGKQVQLSLIEATSSTVFLRQTVYGIAGKDLLPNTSAASIVRITTGSGAVPTIGTNYIRIVKIIGRA